MRVFTHRQLHLSFLLFLVIINTPIISSANHTKAFIPVSLKCHPWCQSPQPNMALTIAPIIPKTAPIRPAINPISPANNPIISPNNPAPSPIQNGKVIIRIKTIRSVEEVDEDERCITGYVLSNAFHKNHSQKSILLKTFNSIWN